MYRFIWIAVLVGSAAFGSWGRPLAVGVSADQDAQKQDQPSKSQRMKKAGASSLTGCVDEQDGKYVLVDDQGLHPVAELVAEGFPNEGFAKHLGHKVTVRGTSSSDGSRPVFKVRSIETVSDVCAPKPERQ